MSSGEAMPPLPQDASPVGPPRGRGPAGWLAAADRVLVCMLWALPAWVLLLRLDKFPLIPEPEVSWVAVMTAAAAGHWQFGKDIIFTYGPLAPLAYSTYSGQIYTLFFVTELLTKAAYVGLIFRLSQRLPLLRRVAFIVTVIFVSFLSWQAADLLAVAGVGVVLCSHARTDRRLGLPLLALPAVLALVKATFLFYSLAMLGAVSLCWLLQKDWRRAVVAVGTFGLFFGGGWVLLGQHLSNLPAYLRGSLEITGGFTQAMSLPAQPAPLVLSLLAAAMLGSQSVLLLWRGRSSWRTNLPMFLLLGAGLLMAWKQAFVRADEHVIDWSYYAMAAVVAAPAFFIGQRTRGALTHWTCILAVIGLSCAAVQRQNPQRLQTDLANLPTRWKENLHVVLHPREDAAAARQQVVESRQAYAMPLIRNAVGSRSVDVFCEEQAVAILNGLPYAPRPSFEGYSTYTPYLAGLNDNYYRSPGAPEYVIYKEQIIDGRLATSEESSLLLRLARDYEPVQVERGYLLFKRGATPDNSLDPAAFPQVSSGVTKVGQALPLPPDTPLWCQLDMRENLLGKLMNFLYQEPPVSLELTSAKGGTIRRRVIPEMARIGFLINPVPESEHDFLLFAAGEPLEAVQSIRVIADRWWQRLFQRRIGYRFCRVPPAAPAARAAIMQALHDLDNYQDGIFPATPQLVKSTAAVERVWLDHHFFLLVHVVGEMDFAIPPRAKMVSGKFTIRPGAWQEGSSKGIDFRIDYAPANGAPATTLFDRFLNPRSEPQRDGPVQSFDVTLPADAAGELVFRTLPGPTGDGSWGWACWADIRFEQ